MTQGNNEFTYDDDLLNPYADVSLKVSQRDKLRLSYSMGKQIADINALNPYVYYKCAGAVTI